MIPATFGAELHPLWGSGNIVGVRFEPKRGILHFLRLSRSDFGIALSEAYDDHYICGDET